jgi:hypothetical protein
LSKREAHKLALRAQTYALLIRFDNQFFGSVTGERATAKNKVKTENRKPKTKNQKPKTKNQKPKTKNQKPNGGRLQHQSLLKTATPSSINPA